jgi:hypothetical protein
MMFTTLATILAFIMTELLFKISDALNAPYNQQAAIYI